MGKNVRSGILELCARIALFQAFGKSIDWGDDYRGSGGPLHLETPDCDNPLFDAFFQAGRQAGYPLTDDVNGFQQEGFGKFDRTTFRGRRFNAARAYLHPVLERSNLTVQCQVLVRRIILKRKEPLGLKSLKEGRQESFVARKLSVVEELLTSSVASTFGCWKSFSIGAFGYRCCT